MGSKHIPVLLAEAISALKVQSHQWYIDGTFGRGGHTSQILQAGGKVLAFDHDQEAIEYGQEHFKNEIEKKQLILVRQNFEKLLQEVEKQKSEEHIGEIHGVLFDFGVSSPQLDSDTRGFSFQYDAELDMRMDDRLGVKAKDLLAILSEKQLKEMFWQYGGEEQSGKIARAIVTERQKHPIQTVGQFLAVIEKVKRRMGHLHPATKVFQALRIVVNDELGSIERVLPQAYEALAPQGRVVTISFHEGEDRLVKHAFRSWEKHGKGQEITHQVVTATAQELEQNPRSRSAKLRIFEKRYEQNDN